MYSQILPNLIIPLNYFFFQINAKNTTIKLQDQISWKCLSTNEMLKIVLYLRYYNKIKKKEIQKCTSLSKKFKILTRKS